MNYKCEKYNDCRLPVTKCNSKCVNCVNTKYPTKNIAPDCNNTAVVAQAAEIEIWKDPARQFSINADYYRGLVIAIGALFGDKAKTADDGTLSLGVLCAKVPEVVAAEIERLRGQIADLLAMHDHKSDVVDFWKSLATANISLLNKHKGGYGWSILSQWETHPIDAYTVLRKVKAPPFAAICRYMLVKWIDQGQGCLQCEYVKAANVTVEILRESLT